LTDRTEAGTIHRNFELATFKDSTLEPWLATCSSGKTSGSGPA